MDSSDEQPPQTPPVSRRESHYGQQRHSLRSAGGGSRSRPQSSTQLSEADYSVPDNFDLLTEVGAPPPVQNPEETEVYRLRGLEEARKGKRRSENSGAYERRGSGGASSKRKSDQTSGHERRGSAGASSKRRSDQTSGHERRGSASGSGRTRTPRSSRYGGQRNTGDEYNVPDMYENLSELASPSPVENPRELELYRHRTLEDERKSLEAYRARRASQSRSSVLSRKISGTEPFGEDMHKLRDERVAIPADIPRYKAADSKRLTGSSTSSGSVSARPQPTPQRQHASRFATQLYTVSYLVLFSILGTLARLGLQWLTFYPGAPIDISVLWANFAGSLFFGFLAEDRRLFRDEWGVSSRDSEKRGIGDEESSSSAEQLAATKAAHSRVKKTIPLYIGLATGFCGSFTSFSSFMRDVFLALSNSLPTPANHPSPSSTDPVSTASTISRNGGYSFMALLAVIILTICLCLSALKVGAHVAILLDPLTPTLPFCVLRKFLDRAVVIIAWGAWLGALLMCIWPPDRPGGPSSRRLWANETWRGQALLACLFAPLGCLLRFYASLKLNGIMPSFPLGTFAVNIFGTAVLGMAYNLQHVRLADSMVGGGRVGCQALQGLMDGFCGCLTTVSTWVAELNGLRRRNAYIYGTVSVAVGLGLLVVIMGSVRWTVGWLPPACVT